LHALSSFQRTGCLTRPRVSARLHRAPSERPSQAVLGEPSKVTSRIPCCQALFSSFDASGFLAQEGFVNPRPPWSSSVTSAGMAPVRRTFQSYDWLLSLVNSSFCARPSRTSEDKKIAPVELEQSGCLLLPAAVRRTNLVILLAATTVCQPRSMRIRKFSFLPLRTTNSSPSIACSAVTRSFSSMIRRSFT
jgi:hypothetical protein